MKLTGPRATQSNNSGVGRKSETGTLGLPALPRRPVQPGPFIVQNTRTKAHQHGIDLV